ncbi:MAG: hypothetical protein ACR2QU_07410 [Gammaproteobacteria bacterium]
MTCYHRHNSNSLARWALAMFVVVWLNMAIQPCLMAAEAILPDQHDDCSHCPEVQHCSDIDQRRCQFVGDYDYDGREPAIPDPHPAFVASERLSPAEPRSPAQVFDHWVRQGAGPDPGPPLYKRHCSYLN